MATLVYATPDDYEDVMQVSAAPDNITSLLRSASLLIARNTVAAYYAADSNTGLPTDAAIIEAFTEATCMQAAVWATLGIDPNLGGLDVPAPKRGKAIGSARIDYDTSASASVAAFAVRQALLTDLCPDAEQVLRTAGLLTTRAWTYG